LVLIQIFVLEVCPSILDANRTNAFVDISNFLFNSTYKPGKKEKFPEKVNVYFELMSIGLRSVEDKQTYHTGLK